MTYTPNWTDPRVKATATRALSFVALYMKANKKSWVSRNELYKHFGNTSRPLGRFSKTHLLIEADSYYNPQTGACKKYTSNPEGIQLVESALGLSPTRIVDQVADQYQEQIATGDFDYKAQSDRLWHPLQFVPRQARGTVMANRGYKYSYDIEAAAPTLLLQRAHSLDPTQTFVYLEYYTHYRSQIRSLIAKETGLEPEQVKEVVNAVLQGSRVSSWQSNKLFKFLDYNHQAIRALKGSTTFQLLKQDIADLWRVLRSDIPVRYIETSKGSRRASVSSKQKSDLYRSLENQVGSSIRRLLKKNKINNLWIHDGWLCDGFIDPIYVEDYVRTNTGYKIKLEWNVYADI